MNKKIARAECLKGNLNRSALHLKFLWGEYRTTFKVKMVDLLIEIK